MSNIKEQLRINAEKEYPALFKVSKTQALRNLGTKRAENSRLIKQIRDKKIVELYKEMTQQEIADRLGFTRQRVQQILKQEQLF